MNKLKCFRKNNLSFYLKSNLVKQFSFFDKIKQKKSENSFFSKFKQTKSEVKEVTKKEEEQSQDLLFDSSNPEFSKLRINFLKSLVPAEKNIKNKINHQNFYENTLDIVKFYSQTKNEKVLDIINSTLLIYLEKNIQFFTLEQMIKMFCEIGKHNVGSIVSFNAFQHNLMKKLQLEKHLIFKPKEEENAKTTQLLFYYFSIIPEISMMEPGPLNYIIEYFAEHSKALITEDLKEADPKQFATLYDFFWLTSLSIASILEKRTHYQQIEQYVDTVSPVLSEKGARGLMKILTFLNRVISLDKNHSQNSVNKVRLFKSLHYLKLEGIDLPDNLIKFLSEFHNFHQMNMEKSVSPSKLEDKFESLLKQINIPYEREKKLTFGSVDFFVSPHICFEVNGPTHYIFDTQIPIAKDFLKMRTLKLEHYDYIPIHYKQITHSEKELLDFLTKRLQHVKDGSLNEIKMELLANKNPSVLRIKENANLRNKIEDRIANSNYLV